MNAGNVAQCRLDLGRFLRGGNRLLELLQIQLQRHDLVFVLILGCVQLIRSTPSRTRSTTTSGKACLAHGAGHDASTNYVSDCIRGVHFMGNSTRPGPRRNMTNKRP